MKRRCAALLGGLVLTGIACDRGGTQGPGGGSGSSEVTVSIDGGDLDSTSQTSGVDAAGNSFVAIAGDDWSIEVRFPGAAAASFASTGGATGVEVIYTDANNNTFVASDVQAGSSYTVDVTSYTGDELAGTFMATVVSPGGVSHSISGTFSLAFAGIVASDPYAGTYMGIWSARGQVLEGNDPETGDPIWGPLQVASVRVTLELDHLATASGTAAYNIVHANISDAFFGCNVGGCTPAFGSSAALPEEPGTPALSGPSLAGQGFVILLEGGGQLLTANDAGQLYTSQDARILSNALDVEESWLADDGGGDYFLATFGDYYFNLNADTREMSWSLARSAL
ncbi:MAG TPA: hypothetical protein VMZ28_16135 [Kofleriaceae bacterium]|nr:hypothetical protein [Kofleriaceae bacterium]